MAGDRRVRSAGLLRVHAIVTPFGRFARCYTGVKYLDYGHYHKRWQMNVVRATVGEGGRIVIPVEFRRHLGLGVGDALILALDGCQIRMFTPDEAINQLQALVEQHFPGERSLADELIAERRAEASRE